MESQTPRGIYFLTDANAVLIWTHSDHRWVLHIPDNGSATTDTVATIREVIGDPDVPVEVLAQTVWTAAAQTATRYAHGPTFLVGDAAHRFPPAGATGVSTAMHDAHNLAWKLAAVLSGRDGGALLARFHRGGLRNRFARAPTSRVVPAAALASTRSSCAAHTCATVIVATATHRKAAARPSCRGRRWRPSVR